MSEGLLIIFLKAPRPGHVKTRLARAIGPEAACEAYRGLVTTLISNLAGIEDVQLRFTPADALEEIRPWLRPGWQACPQSSGNLGERMKEAFADAFEAGANRVVIIGSDCPEVTSADVEKAWLELGRHDVVLGPARDGGYWLVGLTSEQPSLFENIPWSTDAVLDQTFRRIKAAGLSAQLIRTLGDVDTLGDWTEFLGKNARQH